MRKPSARRKPSAIGRVVWTILGMFTIVGKVLGGLHADRFDLIRQQIFSDDLLLLVCQRWRGLCRNDQLLGFGLREPA